ncbi:MAG: hypothetical protein KDC61_04855, partial [Saprospiraceae bacterium]|nr:hypothetical protein [Saprospiraceae bacterium]
SLEPIDPAFKGGTCTTLHRSSNYGSRHPEPKPAARKHPADADKKLLDGKARPARFRPFVEKLTPRRELLTTHLFSA